VSRATEALTARQKGDLLLCGYPTCSGVVGRVFQQAGAGPLPALEHRTCPRCGRRQRIVVGL